MSMSHEMQCNGALRSVPYRQEVRSGICFAEACQTSLDPAQLGIVTSSSIFQ
jgi:hypothetical protein